MTSGAGQIMKFERVNSSLGLAALIKEGEEVKHVSKKRLLKRWLKRERLKAAAPRLWRGCVALAAVIATLLAVWLGRRGGAESPSPLICKAGGERGHGCSDGAVQLPRLAPAGPLEAPRRVASADATWDVEGRGNHRAVLRLATNQSDKKLAWARVMWRTPRLAMDASALRLFRVQTRRLPGGAREDEVEVHRVLSVMRDEEETIFLFERWPPPDASTPDAAADHHHHHHHHHLHHHHHHHKHQRASAASAASASSSAAAAASGSAASASAAGIDASDEVYRLYHLPYHRSGCQQSGPPSSCASPYVTQRGLLSSSESARWRRRALEAAGPEVAAAAEAVARGFHGDGVRVAAAKL